MDPRGCLARPGSWLTLLVVVCEMLTIDVAGVPAQSLVYLDDFEQFAPGADVTTTKHTPKVGGRDTATFSTYPPNAGGTKHAVAVEHRRDATIRGGRPSIAIHFNQPRGTGGEYEARLGTSLSNNPRLSNTSLSVAWDLAVKATNNGLGGFFLRLPSPVWGFQILVGHLDDGAIVIFTARPGRETMRRIGAYRPNRTYRTRVDYDLVATHYSVVVDGQLLLARQPIPDYLERRTIDRFGFDIGEALPESLGNEFVLDNISVCVPACAPNVPGSGGIQSSAASRRCPCDIPR